MDDHEALEIVPLPELKPSMGRITYRMTRVGPWVALAAWCAMSIVAVVTILQGVPADAFWLGLALAVFIFALPPLLVVVLSQAFVLWLNRRR